MQTMPVCQHCGEENPARARFCLACAAPLAAPPAPRREERKVVSVLFCDLVGFTSRAERLDIEDVRGVLAPYYQRLRGELERFGGTVEKFIGDAVMALFGAPAAHEDDPERAVRAALAIREAITEFNDQDPGLDLHVRVGVTTGEALVALDARPAEGEGMASGDVVNTAARLQAAAPVDGILVDEATWRATDRQISYQPAKAVQAKGKADPVGVWQALAARSSLGVDVAQEGRAPLVGRERELDLLADTLARARSEQTPQLVTLVGVPGIGKSRLVFELLQLVEAEPELVTWRQGRCLPYGEGVALWALGEIMKAQAGILDSDPAEAADAKLTQTVADLIHDEPEAAWVTGQLRPLVGLPGDTEMSGDRRAEAFAAWRRFVEAVVEQGPTVLVVEDLHWADEVLLDFLDHLVDWAADVPLLLVATTRPELLGRRPGWGGGKPNSAIVSLAPLSEADTARLVGGLMGQAVLPADTQAALLMRAGGNPLYAEEYVRMLVDRGFLRRTGRVWRLEATDQLPLPETVQGIIAARLDTLSPEEKRLLQDAAVLGKVGWLGALAALGDLPRWTAEQRLHALERRELLRRERRSQVAGERQYAFRHVLVRDVAYSQLPRAARADRHRRAAQWIETLSPNRAEDRAELLAHHYHAALEFARAAGQDTASLAERARLALREAGDRALDLNAFAAAKRHYAESVTLWPRDSERARLLFHYGKAWFRTEGGGGEALEEALHELLMQGNSELAAEAEVILGELRFRQGDRDGAFARFEHALALLADAPPSLSKAYVLSTLSRFHSVALEADTAIRIGRQALKMAEDLGLDEVRAHALNNIGFARVARADAGGIDDLERSLAITLARNSPESVRTYLNLGTNLADFGDLRRTFAVHAEGRRAAERFGDKAGMQWFAAERLWELYWRGGWDEAVATSGALLADAEAGSPRSHSEPGVRLVRGWIALPRGQLDEALEDATRLRDFAREARDLQSMFPALALRARILASAGRYEQARADAAELLRIWQQSDVSIGSYWTADLAFAVSQLGRDEDLLAPLAAAPPTPWVAAARAVATWEFEQAAALYAEIGSLPDEALARLCNARRLVAAGRRDKANAELHRAFVFHRRVRAERYVQEGEALLAAAG
jgi:class 3 adenylate cyclase/tetratricopeptide (TPR) repeat protein